MINVTLHTVAGNKTFIATGMEKVNDFIESNGVSTYGASIAIDGKMLTTMEAKSTFNELGITGGNIRISLVVKQNNAVSATVEGDAVVIISAMKREDLVTIQKYDPESLTLFDENENQIFRIMVTDCELGDVDKDGIIFGKTTTEDGYATVTSMLINKSEKDQKEAAKESFGRILIRLRKLEAQLTAILESVNADKALIDDLFA